MKRVINYEDFLNKVYGCFIGKAITGNIGAPYEGLKMPLELEYMPSMVNPDLPNDDLDLQVLWLDVVEKKGENFTSYDLLKAFCTNCDYSPGEYQVMRKNYMRGVYPPYSGKFSNDYYIEGMGCPIRSEVWSCLAVGNPALATEFAGRDGQLDHYGESIWAEKFLAALECEAFFESDIHKLIDNAMSVLPADSKFRALAEYTVELCAKYDDIKVVLTKILARYGHPDCTNMYQNMGITIAALLLGEMDIIKTGIMALNCGFDTDCTCATAGAIIGILRGANELKAAYNLNEVTYVLAVRSNRRSNKILDLAEDIAKLAVQFSKTINSDIIIQNAPEVSFDFEKLPDFSFRADYENMTPSIQPGGKCKVYAQFTNNTALDAVLKCNIATDSNIMCEMDNFTLSVAAGQTKSVPLDFAMAKDVDVVSDKNIFTVTAEKDGKCVLQADFGICGAIPWKLSGPFWRTEPVTTTQMMLDNIEAKHPYGKYIPDSCYRGSLTDKMRFFHLNFATDTQTEYIGEDELFSPASDDFASRVYEQKAVFIPEDSFKMDDFFGFKGPCVAYLSRIIVAPEDMTVCMQVGYSSPFALYVNGQLLDSRDNCDNWTAENVHLGDIQLKKGENRVVIRMTRANSDAKYSLIISKGLSMTEHFMLTSKNPYKF